MSILREIQEALLTPDAELSTILLKLRFLASRLGSEPLEDWVKYETEGYPPNFDVPEYRKIRVNYKGHWSGPLGRSIANAPIPPYLIKEHAGEAWLRHEVRESIAGVEKLAKKEEEDGPLQLNAANLILALQGKVYERWACNSISGSFSPVAMREIKQSVRSRILELTIQFEKRVPEALEVTLQKAIPQKPTSEAAVTQIVNNIVYGNVTHVTATDKAQVNLSITAGDVESMASELVKAGLPQDAAKEISEIVAAEKPESADKPLGSRALAWIKENASKAAGGAWKISSDVLTSVLTEAALKFYGLKP